MLENQVQLIVFMWEERQLNTKSLEDVHSNYLDGKFVRTLNIQRLRLFELKNMGGKDYWGVCEKNKERRCSEVVREVWEKTENQGVCEMNRGVSAGQ